MRHFPGASPPSRRMKMFGIHGLRICSADGTATAFIAGHAVGVSLQFALYLAHLPNDFLRSHV